MRWLVNTSPLSHERGTILNIATTIDAAMELIMFNDIQDEQTKSILRQFFFSSEAGDNFVHPSFSIVAIPVDAKSWGDHVKIYEAVVKRESS